MISRVKVPQIFKFSVTNELIRTQQADPVSCCYADDRLILVGFQKGSLAIYGLPDLVRVGLLQTNAQPTKIVANGPYFFVIYRQSMDITCIEQVQGSYSMNCNMAGHLLPVNDIMLFQGTEPISCSDDYTLRIWQSEEPFEVTKILAGHQGKVKALEQYRSYIVSGSSDNEIIFWKNRLLHYPYKLESPVDSLVVITETHLLACALSNGHIQLLSIKKIAQKQLVKLHRIDLQSDRLKLYKLDDYFVGAVSDSGIYMVEVYLGKLIRKVPVSGIVYMLQFRTMMLLATSKSVFLQNLADEQQSIRKK